MVDDEEMNIVEGWPSGGDGMTQPSSVFCDGPKIGNVLAGVNIDKRKHVVPNRLVVPDHESEHEKSSPVDTSLMTIADLPRLSASGAYSQPITSRVTATQRKMNLA